MSQDERDRKCAANHVLETGLRHLQDRRVAAPADTPDLLHLFHLESRGLNPKTSRLLDLGMSPIVTARAIPMSSPVRQQRSASAHVARALSLPVEASKASNQLYI